MEEVKFIKTGDEFSNIATKLKQECIDYLTQVTKEHGLIKFNLEQYDECVCISYDGGRHPEHGTDLYSTVYSIIFNDDENRLSIILNCYSLLKYNVKMMKMRNILKDKYIK